jgi:benzoylformate decarboxylase
MSAQEKMQSAKVTVREATLSLFRSFGINTIFGNPGSTELEFFRDWPQDFKYVLGLQEASVVAMADGYAQVTGNAAAVSLHSAAGLGHALGNIFTAYRNKTPLVIIAGQQTRAMLPTEPYLFATSAEEFPKPYVKWSCQPACAENVPAAIARAYYTAMENPCGPTFVSVPTDDWEREADLIPARQISQQFAPDPAGLQQIADALNGSERPALIVGPGVDQDGAWDLVIELAERARAGVWNSPFSSHAGFPEDHPLFAGFLPPVRQQLTDKLRGYDLIVVFSAPIFTFHVYTGGPAIPSGARLFQITSDPAEAAYAPVGTSILATPRLALAQLLQLLEKAERPMPAARLSRPVPQASNPMSGAFVMHTIAQMMPRDAIIVEEAPTHRDVMHDYLPIRTAGGFYTTASGGLGYSLPAAVGIALGSPTRKVIGVLGDGSSLYSIQALWTAAQERLPITFLILNNSEYAAMKSFGMMTNVDNPPGVDLPGIDFVSIARGFGCAATRVEKAQDLAGELSAALAYPMPALLDIIVDPSIVHLY